MKSRLIRILIKMFNILFSTHIEPVGLKSYLRFAQEQQESYRAMKTQFPESNIDLYMNDPELLFKNVKALMYYQIIPDDLHELLNALGEAQNRPQALEEFKDLVAGYALYYSQEGEDVLLARFFDHKKEGFFVDVGAHHPKRFSNTYYFYKLGWKGINIEPNLDVNKLFDDIRPEDINIETAIGNKISECTFYMFKEPALNTFSQSLAAQYERAGQKLMTTKSISVRKLSSVLDEHCNNRRIDFMSIDVEDFEMSVLESNDWIKYRPKMLLIEILDFDINHPEKYPVHNFVINKGYAMWAKTYNTVFYEDKKEESSW